MNAYFTNISPSERENILDKHKHVYDGYATNNIQPNQQPLYVQDFANDKNGLVVNNKGNVKNYTNVNINEEITTKEEVVDKYTFVPVDEEEFESYSLEDIRDGETKEKVQEQVEKSLDMFKRFKNFN